MLCVWFNITILLSVPTSHFAEQVTSVTTLKQLLEKQQHHPGVLAEHLQLQEATGKTTWVHTVMTEELQPLHPVPRYGGGCCAHIFPAAQP